MTPLESSLYQKTLACVHCGLCLPACPAYRLDPRESLAPRGQVYNVRAVLEGRLPLEMALAAEIYECLACRGCESVCPSGVPVGAIMEEARGLITERKLESRGGRLLKRFLLAGILAHPRRLAAVMALASLYERLGLRWLVRRFLVGLSPALAERERLMPALATKRRSLPLSAPASGERRGRVALFTGCIASHLFSDVNEATVRVLQRNGYEVVVPKTQVCCGALQLHNGLPEVARRLARENLRAFAEAPVDWIVVNAAGCGATLSEYGELLKEARAHDFARRVVDVSLLLVREGFEPPREGIHPVRVAYDAPCHLFHGQRVRAEPRALLKAIPGVTLVEHAESERCCGSAGIYNVTHYRMSMEVLESKMRELGKVRPEVIATGNPGCLLQLAEGARRHGLEAEVVHPVVLLDRAYRTQEAREG